MEEPFVLSKSLVQILSNFLMRLCIFSSDNKDAVVAKLSSRCSKLFLKLTFFPCMKAIPLPYFEKLLQNALEQFSSESVIDLHNKYENEATTNLPGRMSPPANTPNLSGEDTKRTLLPFSETILINFVDIITAGLSCVGGPNNVFEQHAGLIKDLIEPIFALKSKLVYGHLVNMLKKVCIYREINMSGT